MNQILRCCALAMTVTLAARCDTGVITQEGADAPDPRVLAIDSLDVSVRIDNGHATVSLKEVFANKSRELLEGSYELALPDNAAVSDFAVWDGLTRIPGVILERKRAAELYENIRNQAIDPGLLESGDITESTAPGQARHRAGFSVKIVPIPAFGYKRIEASYRETVKLAQLGSDFVLPLKASTAQMFIARRFSLRLELLSAQTIDKFDPVGGITDLKIIEQTPHRVLATLDRDSMPLVNDLELRYSVANDPAPRVTAYRSAATQDPGYFETSAILQSGRVKDASAKFKPRRVIVLFDTSLSMQWDKLEQSFRALEGILRALGPNDEFNVLVFNSETARFATTPQPARPETVARSLDFVRSRTLRGGTNLGAAFREAFAQSIGGADVVLLSDGETTEGTIAPARLIADIERQWKARSPEDRPHLYTFAVGDDANTRLMRRISEHGGVFEQVTSTEPLDFKLANFVHQIGLPAVSPVTLTTSPGAQAKNVYRMGQDDFPGSLASWVGEYGKPGSTQFSILSGTGAEQRKANATVSLPANDTFHEYLPISWARARVDALLEKIDRDGEDKATIEEIIKLSRKYHFVTPYTSFLAAPRALLRPRLIRPGDPILRVRTDPSIASVVALFPFGVNKPLRYLQREDIWQTRFLAPDDLADGSYVVRLVLRDREGRVYQENKTFLISSHAPVVRATTDSPRVHRGSEVLLHVQASATTRTITAQLYGAPTIFLHWQESDRANTGRLVVPAQLAPGRYSVHVVAEDIAHNISYQEMPLEVLP